MPSLNLPKNSKFTFKEFEREFPDDAACMRWLVGYLYPQSATDDLATFRIHCLGCAEVRPHHQLKNRPKVWTCDYCGTHTHPTAGTIFHKSKTSLKTWFHAIYLMSATRCGISAMQLMRETGVTYKCAWRMFNLIRKMLLEDVHDLGGDKIVEADETFYGPKFGRMNRKARRRLPTGLAVSPNTAKIVIAGLVERGGRIVAYPVERRGFFELTQPIKKRVLPGSEIHTDEAPQYVPLKHWGYVHRLVKHQDGVYVDADGVGTNTIEGFWSHFKGSVRGVYKHVSRKHIQGYLDEYAFRYNHRDDGKPMFRILSGQISQAFVEHHFPKKHRPRKVTF